jgi:hypothetical protein
MSIDSFISESLENNSGDIYSVVPMLNVCRSSETIPLSTNLLIPKSPNFIS